MKKLIFASVLALATLGSCQNENNEDTTVNNQELSDKAIALVKDASNGVVSKDPNRAYISCHDNYNNLNGNACVWVNGWLFNVTWADDFIINPRTGQTESTTTWTSTEVSHCTC